MGKCGEIGMHQRLLRSHDKFSIDLLIARVVLDLTHVPEKKAASLSTLSDSAIAES